MATTNRDNSLDTAADTRIAESAEDIKSQEMLLNMGPQHPSTHGVLRLVLTLEGETIVNCTPVIGYLHRGMEKIFENRTIMQGIRYTDNSDYLSPMLCEIAYVGAAEQVMGLEPPRRAQYIRLLVGEMQRIGSHLVAVGTYLLDLGAFTPVLWAFRDREGMMTLFEALAGSRFTVNYMRVGGVLHDFPHGWLKECENWLDGLEEHMAELEGLITGNEIFEARTQGIGYIDPQQAIAYGLTGPMARGVVSTGTCVSIVPTWPIERCRSMCRCARREIVSLAIK
jgi:NADH-quinone oxidoreductase subunit D